MGKIKRTRGGGKVGGGVRGGGASEMNRKYKNGQCNANGKWLARNYKEH